MDDREKVIEGLECCVAYDYKCNVCRYKDDGGAEDGCYSDELKADALALLKAQEQEGEIVAERKVYYFITVFEKLDIDCNGNPDVGSSRCWGFYTDKETAFQAVHENWTDMEETVYKYALIEGYHEGISHYTGFRQFFKYDINKDGYFEIDEPNGYEHSCCYGIG